MSGGRNTEPGGAQGAGRATEAAPDSARRGVVRVAPAATATEPSIPRGHDRLHALGVARCRCRHRPVQFLNNILEQDHRAINRRVKAKQGYCEFHAARRTIQGYEAMHMIRKGQAKWVSGSDVRQQIQFINKLFEVVA